MSQLKKVCLKLTLVEKGAKADGILNLIEKYESINKDKSLKRGYKEMAQINLSLAEMCIEADNEALRQYEEKLTECE